MPTIKQIIAEILKREGGYVNHPADRGGPTNHGITRTSYAEYFRRQPQNITLAEIKAITPQVAERIYYTLYYVRPQIASLHPLVQPIVFDMSVNHGCHGAVSILQTALSSLGYHNVAIDGFVGPKTIAVTAKAVKDLGHNLINSIVDSRLNYYQEIINTDPSQAVFKDGWFARAESFRQAA